MKVAKEILLEAWGNAYHFDLDQIYEDQLPLRGVSRLQKLDQKRKQLETK